jgi:signal transduction histidine kinase/CheY-like chemotaxis protein
MIKSGFRKIHHSIRTHFGILTSCILLSLLLVFYLGSRYIMLSVIHEVEKEIGNVSNNIKSFILKQSHALQQFTSQQALLCANMQGRQLTETLKSSIRPNNQSGIPTHLVLFFNLDGSLRDGYYSTEGTDLSVVDASMVETYFGDGYNLAKLCAERGTPISGTISFQGTPYYISIAPVSGENATVSGSLCTGTIVHNSLFFREMSEVSQGLSVALEKNGTAAAEIAVKRGDRVEPAPIFTKNLLFTPESDWKVGSADLKAIIPIQDILGREISALSISFPRSFAAITTIGLGYLTVFVAGVGILFIVPIFWLQGKFLLDPLSKMERDILAVADKFNQGGVEYLKYESDDEFGRVARSMDRLIYELNGKSEQIAHDARRQNALLIAIPDCLCTFNGENRLIAIEKHPDKVAPVPGIRLNHPLSSEYFKGESIFDFEQAITHVLSTGEIQNVSMLCRDVNNLLRYFETRLTQMDDNLVLVVFRDVTNETLTRKRQERIEAREGKAQQMSSLGNLAAGIAHDFNNILSIIKNTLELQDCSTPTVEAAKENADVIREASNRGSTLVQELMTYAGQNKVNLRRIKPSEIISELTPLYKGVIRPNVTLDISLGQNICDVMVDADQFWKVIVNLVKNASESIKSTHGYIKISTYSYEITAANSMKFFSTQPLEPARGVVFEVSDNGDGIPQWIVDRLFEPFFSTKSIGRGLGLATVFGIVDSHNGGVNIFSREHIGTKFRIWLPAADPEGELDYTDDTLPAQKGERGFTASSTKIDERLSVSCKPAVLVIDDDPSIIKTTSMLLKAMGIGAFTASSRTEALARYRKYSSSINLVMMDAQLGDLDSVRLLATLRMNRENLPVVICSGHAQEKIAAMFATSDIAGILIKPYTMAELRDMLMQFMPLDTQNI